MSKADQSEKPTSPNRRMGSIRNFPGFTFFALTFLISWSFWGISLATGGRQPDAAAYHGLLGILGVFGPFFAAVIRIKSQKKRLRTWLKKRFRFRLPGHSYVLPFVFLVIALFLTGSFHWITGENVDLPTLDTSLVAFLSVMFGVNLLIRGGQEELGWRGYALPALQKRFSALAASLILGFLQGLWYLPLAYLTGFPSLDLAFVFYLLLIMAVSVVYTFLYNSTGSVVITMLFHSLLSTFSFLYLLPGVGPDTVQNLDLARIPLSFYFGHFVAWFIIATVLAAIFGPEKLAPLENPEELD